MNKHVGEHNWYIAGGCAAWLHIDAYADKEATDYPAFKMQIIPGDIEGGVSEAGKEELVKRYGDMKVNLDGRLLDVSLYAKPPEQLQAQVDLCVTFALPGGSVLLISPRNLITAYSTAGNPDKAAKRQLRVAIMTLMLDQKRITKNSVETKLQTARPSIGQSILAGGLGGFKLRSVKK